MALMGGGSTSGGGPRSAGTAAAPLPFTATAAAVRNAAVAVFRKTFNDHLRLDAKPWDGKEALAAFEAAADAHVSEARSQRVRDAATAALKAQAASLSGPVIALLDASPPNLWPCLHAVAASAADTTEKGLLQASAVRWLSWLQVATCFSLGS